MVKNCNNYSNIEATPNINLSWGLILDTEVLYEVLKH